MNCSEVQELLSAYFDHELDVPTREIVSVHLEDCQDCSQEIDGFESLSKLASGLGNYPVPEALWNSIASTQSDKPTTATEAEKVQLAKKSFVLSRRQVVMMASGLALVLLIVSLIFWVFDHGHDHEEMVEAMEHIAENINTGESESLLMTKFGGQMVSADEAMSEVGFQPVSTSVGLPDGYEVKNIQVLTMPCCKCTQTICTRKDGTQFYVFEHVNEDTGWFEEKEKEEFQCCGKECELVRLNEQLVVTWKKGKRHITMLGMRNKAEIELIVEKFEST